MLRILYASILIPMIVLMLTSSGCTTTDPAEAATVNNSSATLLDSLEIANDIVSLSGGNTSSTTNVIPPPSPQPAIIQPHQYDNVDINITGSGHNPNITPAQINDQDNQIMQQEAQKQTGNSLIINKNVNY